MTPELWRRISALYSELAELPPAEREPRLAALAASEPALHQELVRLFSAAPRDGSGLLDRPPLGAVLAPLLAADSRLRPGEVLADRFEIIAHRGSGGMGEVYEAEDRDLRARVALKLIRRHVAEDAASLSRFRREIALARQVTHRSVCRVYDFFPGASTRSGQRVDFLTMELIEGETLAQMLARRAPLPLAEALPILRQIAEGLDAAHAAGILHRDLKGSNVLLGADAAGLRAVLTDFGLARSAHGNEGFTTATAAGAGTPLFMSPEQMEGGELGPASDLYSLGVLMYQMATGSVPLQELTPLQIAAKRAKEPARPPSEILPGVDRAWEAVILRALDIDPARRFRSGAELIAALEHPSRFGALAVPRAPRAALRRGAAAAGLVLAAAGGWWAWDRSRAAPLPPDALRFYQEGATAVADGAVTKAARLLERSLQSAPGFLAARCRLAEAFAELDMRDRAQEQLLRAIDLRPRDTAERQLCDGVRAVLIGDWPRALAAARDRLASAGTPEARAAAHYDLARWSDRASRLDDAAAAYRAIIQSDASQPGALLRLSDLRWRQGQRAESATLLDRAAAVYRALGNGEALGEVALARTRTAAALPDAVRHAEEAEARARDAGSDWLRIRALRRRAEILRDQGDSAAYRRLALQAVQQAEQAGLPAQAADALIDLGYASFAQGHYEEAEPDYQRALQLAGRFQARRTEARARSALAQWHMSQSQFPQAAALLDQALAFYREIGSAGQIAQTHRYRGDLLQRLGRFEEARQAFQQALAASANPGDQLTARNRLVYLARQQMRHEEAAAGFAELVAAYERQGNRVQSQFFRIEQARALIALGRFPDAARELAAVRAQQPANDFNARRLAFAEAFLDLQQMRFAPALAQLEALRRAARQERRAADERDYAYDLCLWYAEAGRTAQSLPLCEQAKRDFAGRGAQAMAAFEAMTLNFLARREPLRAAAEARQAIALAEQAKDLRNRWYDTLLLASALHAAQDPAWKAARDAAAALLAQMKQEWGQPSIEFYLSRPLIGRRLRAVEQLQ